MSNKQVVYWDYLKLEQLLKLQNGLDDNENEVSEDELHFIIVHQVFELWFKLAIREINLAREKMGAPKVEENQIPNIVHHLKRVNTIMKMASEHFFLMETLTPQDFLEFRAKLGTASGFQSFQMREMEILLGLQQQERDRYSHGDPTKYIMESVAGGEFGNEIGRRIEFAKSSLSLRASIHKWLYRTPIQGSDPSQAGDTMNVENFTETYLTKMKDMNEAQLALLISDGGDEDRLRKQFEMTLEDSRKFLNALDIPEETRAEMRRIRAAILFIESYRDLPLVSWPRNLLDSIVELEEHFLTFRFRHARMVERIIGRRVGTGGSSGVDYLDQTLNYRIFPELWAVRTILLPRNKLPNLQSREMYSFKIDQDN